MGLEKECRWARQLVVRRGRASDGRRSRPNAGARCGLGLRRCGCGYLVCPHVRCPADQGECDSDAECEYHNERGGRRVSSVRGVYGHREAPAAWLWSHRRHGGSEKVELSRHMHSFLFRHASWTAVTLGTMLTASREQMSRKCLHHHVAKFARPHNRFPAATADQMTMVAQRMAGQRLRDQDLIIEDDSGLRLTAVAH